MTVIATKSKSKLVPLMLTGGRVTGQFRSELFAASNRDGLSVNEWVLRATAEKLQASDHTLSGLFSDGDIEALNRVRLKIIDQSAIVYDQGKPVFDRVAPMPAGEDAL